MFYANLTLLGKKSNSVIRSRSVNGKNWFNVSSMEAVTVYGHPPEFGRGGGGGGSYCFVRSPYLP